VAVGTAASHVFDFHAALPCATMPLEQRGNTQLQPFCSRAAICWASGSNGSANVLHGVHNSYVRGEPLNHL
jgi:hypothetical protein